MASLKNHPGMWLRDDAAAALNAFEDRHGVIIVNSAGRTEAEQQKAIDRWNKGGAANRPPRLYRPASPAATSPHVIDGGIAIDIRDYNTWKDELREFGFHWFGAGDPVHFNFRGWAGAQAGARPGYQDGSAELRRFQEKLIRMGHDLGPTGADAVLGEHTKRATLFEQGMAEKNGYPGGNVTDDSLPGAQTEAYLDWWLVGRHGRPSSKSHTELTYADIQAALNRHGYNLKVDNAWGPKSSHALADFQGRNGLKVDRVVGEQTWDKLNR